MIFHFQTRILSFMYGVTFLSAVSFFNGLTQNPDKTDDNIGNEGYMKLRTQFSQNKFGYNTRFMSDFDTFLEAFLNNRFINESTDYYQDEVVSKEIEDMEAGLVGDFSKADIKNLMKDHEEHSHEPAKCLMHPDRVGTNYPKDDSLSCYKILPKRQ